VFGALFGTVRPPVAMATWMPPGPRPGRRARGPEATVGILHPFGREARRRLAEAGTAVPDGWRMGQDHSRRGLIVHPPAAVPAPEVLAWALDATAVLSGVPLTGRWKAVVYRRPAR
jgi:hypothetical protein